MLIDLQKARPGMVVAEDISNPQGGILIRKHQSLNENMISVLLRSGIKEINVQDTTSAPALELILSEDLMSATLIIDPCGENCSDINSEMIVQALNQKKIVYGIDEERIQAIADQWNQKKQRIQIKDIVKGTPAIPATEGLYQMTVAHLTTKDLISKIRSAHYFWEIAQSLPPQVKIVPSGTIIAKKQEDTPSISGMNILGEPIFSSNIIKRDLNLTDSVYSSSDNNYLIAKTQGIPFFCDDTIGVIFLKPDGSVDIIVRDDKMAASILVHPPCEGGSMPKEQEILDMLRARGVVYGILHQRISELVRNFSNNKYPEEPVVIAEGVAARNGENGYVKLLFNTETSLKPQQNPDGSVDYKNINIINTVVEKQKLAELVPPTSGVAGKNISGQTLPCIDGTAARLPVGQNTIIDPDNPNVLLSATDGFVRYFNSTIEVSEGLIIPGNVDFSTGHIKYGKNVVINGDVKSGFNVECGGDLQVNGTIEDSKITIGGNLLCRMGFVGQGKGLIDAKGDVNLNFTKNQIIKSRQNINIAKEAINSTIFARKTITVHGKPLSVAGGLLTAGESISIYTVGNQSGIKTVLEVGVDFTMVEELGKKELLFVELSDKYSKLLESGKNYEKILIIRKQLPPKERFLLERIKNAISKYKQQLDLLEKQKAEICSKMHNTANAFIKIEHTAMPGTLLKFGERHYLVKDEIIGPKTVRMIDHEIKVL